MSDVSGVLFGGALERLLCRLSLIRAPCLTTAQRQLAVCRNVSMLGAVVGVIVGCALGATTLLAVDLEARNRIERAVRLREIVNDMISVNHHCATPFDSSSSTAAASASANAPSSFQCDSCTVYVVSTKDLTLPVVVTANDDENSKKTEKQWKTVLKAISDAGDDDDVRMAAVRQCADSRAIVVTDERRSLYAPLVKRNAESNEDEVMAVVAFCHGTATSSSSSSSSSSNGTTNNSNSSGGDGGFSDEDVLTARVMARHIAIFMDRLAN